MGNEMNKVQLVKAIVKAYFVAAVVGSFTHIIHAAHLIGLSGWEMWSTPFLIDGIAIVGLVMRSEQFSKDTQKWGRITQYGAGTLSLVANVYAAEGNIGGIIYGVAIVALFLFAEFLSGKIQSADVDKAAELADKRKAAAVKAAKTRKANAHAKATMEGYRKSVEKNKARAAALKAA